LVDPSTGDFYYENETTSETQWEIPDGVDEPTTSVIGINNMITEDDLEGDHEQLMADIIGECSEFGEVEKCIIPKLGEAGAGTVYVKFSKGEAAARKARDQLVGSVYAAGVPVEIYFKAEEWFNEES
ncbi:hypothetical protein TrLO_g5680, partial [Triparma laevis f. longispina]